MTEPLDLIERPPLLSRAVRDAIQNYILSNNLRAGDPLPSEQDLCRRLGVSRTSVREAIKSLESLGILDIKRGSGVFVRPFTFEPILENLSYGLLFDLKELRELLAVRRALETGMIEDAIEHMTAEQFVALSNVTAIMGTKAEKGERFVEQDQQFHLLLFQGLKNATFSKLVNAFWLTFRKASEHKNLTSTTPIKTYRDHVRILEAVEAGDPDKARQALNQHYSGIAMRLKDVITKEPEGL